MPSAIHALRNAGYRIVQKSPWHFQFMCGKLIMNIWPSKNKYMVEYGSGASLYRDTEDLLRIMADAAKNKFPYVDRIIKEQNIDHEARAAWRSELSTVFAHLRKPCNAV